MPTNLDTLQIEIKSSATDASSAIKNLVTSLKNLNKQLGLKNGTQLVNLLDAISGSATNVSAKLNNMTGSGLDKVTKGAETAQKAIQQLKKDGEDLQKTLEGFHTPDLDKAFGLAYSKKRRLGADAYDGAHFSEVGFTIPNWDDSAPQKVADTIGQKLLPAVIDTHNYAAELAKDFAKIDDKDFAKIADVNSFKDISAESQKVKSAIEEAIEKAREFRKVISDMEGGNTSFDLDKYKEAIKGYEQATEKIKNFKKELTGNKEVTFMKDVLPELIELGEGFERLSHHFEKLSKMGMSIFKALTTPLKLVASEYAEKFEKIKNNLDNFKEHFQKSMSKVSQFWKRTMKTFTFMLVRKAITAIIKEVGNAVQSLAMYSNAMGTAFNTDISNMVADFQYLGRSIVSVFAPLLNYIAPIIDAITDRIAILISYIGMLFAALGGSSTFTKAKKNVNNYAESLDNASKSAKNLTMGIDELNILSEKSGGGSSKPYDGWEDAWEEVNIPQWLKDISKDIKDFWKKFFDPLKEAWNRAKQYLIDGYKTMLNSLKTTIGHIADDFLEVWNQEKTVRMFEQILRIAGDLMRVVRNLANQFDKAWQKANVGLHIFENLRDILSIIVEHVRNVSYYMIGWAKEIDFSPMLISFEELTKKMKPFADFIGGIFEDIMKNGVLKYIEFIINDAIPHMNETLAGILDTFSFNTLRENLKPVWSAIEEMLEQIHTGVTNAIGNLGKELAKFTSSKDFTDFLQTIVDLTKLITKERVEKVLTGLGKGILNLAKALVKFVNSKPFQAFFKFVAAYIDSKTVDQIAQSLERLAGVIIAFKFTAFATSKLAGFFKFFSLIVSAKNLGSIVSELGKLSKGLKETGVAAETISAGASKLVSLKDVLVLVGKALGAIATAYLEFKGVSDSVEKLVEGTGNLALNITELVASVGLAAGAFTLLFGFPAGVIAAGCVAAVGAIKGISDAVEQINMDHIFDGVLSKGDLTIQQVKDWYNEITDTVGEHINKWKDAERNLTQDRGDLEEYTKALSEFSSVFESGVGATASMADNLLKKYENLGTAIDNYIDQSTDALVSNILAQKAFLETQGIDVNQIIVDIYRSADANKKAVDDSVQGVKEAVQGLDGLTEGTAEYAKQMEKVAEASSTATEKLSPYIDTFSNIDTTSAVQEIEKLGNSLDLSQYGGDWDAAGQDIKNHIADVTTKYKEQMGELKSEADRLKGEIDIMPGVTQEQKNAAKLAIDQSYEEVSGELTSKTKDVFDFYASSLATQMQGVADQAHTDWQTFNPLKKLWYGSEDNYVLLQMETYAKKMLGQEGLAGAFSKGFQALPGEVDPKIIESMEGIVSAQRQAFDEKLSGNEQGMKNTQKSVYENVLSSIGELDFDTPANDFATKSFSAVEDQTNKIDYDKFGQLFVGNSGAAVLSNSQLFEDSNRLVANDGAAAFSQEYRNYLTDNQEIISAIGDTGATYGESLVEGLNKKIEDDAPTSETSITEWFTKINSYIHDNPIMPFGSPNKKTEEYGKDLVEGFNLGIDKKIADGSVGRGIINLFTKVNSTIRDQLTVLKTNLSTQLNTIFASVDLTQSVNKIFTKVILIISNQLSLLGAELQGNLLPTFFDTYILPFFSEDMWSPLFDTLNTVFQTYFETFSTWFTESMTVWWEEGLLVWFADDKWNEDLFEPLKENIQSHWETFSSWWDTTMSEWWENQVKPWFAKDLWKEQLNNILEITKEVFDLIVEAISERMEEAAEAVAESCEEMINALEEVAIKVDQMLDKLDGFKGFQGKVTFDFGAQKFATGGFPTRGSLFWAGEGSGVEMVGSVGGRTGVVSNDEITGIADAVYATGNNESELLGQLIQIAQAMLSKDPVVISDKDIARMNNSGQSKLGMSIIS